MKRGLLFYQSPAGVQLQHQETQVNTWLPKNSRHDFTLRQSPVTSLLEVKGGVNEWLLGDQENSLQPRTMTYMHQYLQKQSHGYNKGPAITQDTYRKY